MWCLLAEVGFEMKFITEVINTVCMVKSNVYGKGFLIRTESGHHNAQDIFGYEIRPEVFKRVSENLCIALALNLQLT